MSALADYGMAQWRGLLAMAAEQVEYGAYGPYPVMMMPAYVRGITNADLSLFGAAMQNDIIAVMNPADFVANLAGRPRPMKFDRLRTLGDNGELYTVEAYRASPAYGGEPVVFRLLLRGGHV